MITLTLDTDPYNIAHELFQPTLEYMLALTALAATIIERLGVTTIGIAKTVGKEKVTTIEISLLHLNLGVCLQVNA